MSFDLREVTIVPPKDDLEHLLAIDLKGGEPDRAAFGAAVPMMSVPGGFGKDEP
jgi:hypothetical protein